MTSAQSKSEALFARVREDILTLELPPDRPLRLPALAKRYEIGMTPLRECLNRLCSHAFVVPEHNKGFRVAPLTRDDLLDLERSRNAIEGAMFVYSVNKADDAYEASVVGTYHHLSNTPSPSALQPPDELAIWTRRHTAFHSAIISGSNSRWMRRFATQLNDQLGRYQRFIQNGLRDLTRTHPALAEHAASVFADAMALAPHTVLYDSAMARDANAARAAFEAHSGLTIATFESLTSMMPDDTAIAATLGRGARAR